MYLHLLKSTYKIELIKLFLYVKHALQKRADAVYIESWTLCSSPLLIIIFI